MLCDRVLNKIGILGTASGLLMAIAAVEPAKAQETVNCPGIFYREPFTLRVSAPAGCPPTEYDRSQMSTEPDVPLPERPTSPVLQPPLPEERSQPVARVMPAEGLVTVSLINNTGDPVTYEVVGDTQRRTLMVDETIMLRGLTLPSTITAVRQGDALLDMEVSSSETGMIEVSLIQASELSDHQGVLRIQQDGKVFIN